MNDNLSRLYEVFGWSYVEGFSEDLYDADIYTNIATNSGLVAISSIVIMYYVYFNWLRITNSTIAWLLWVIVTCIICAMVAYTISYSALYDTYAKQNQNLPYGFARFFQFAVINALWVFLFCWVFSVAIKGKSPHGKGTPHLWPYRKTKTKKDTK